MMLILDTIDQLRKEGISDDDAGRPECGWQVLDVCSIEAQGGRATTTCDAAEEMPVAFAYGGIPYAVMMATPTDLADLAVGFSVTEGVAPTAEDIRGLRITRYEAACEIDITLTPKPFQAFLRTRRVRALRGHTSCGVCGVEDLSDLPELPVNRAIASKKPVSAHVLREAAASLRASQPISQRTHAAHAAAWAAADGRIILAREDVGRHCALDKLIGACLRNSIDLSDGFCLVTSRCSFEMVQKAVMARMSTLAAVSAPTALAIRTARAAGLTLVARVASGTGIISVEPAPDNP